MANDESQKHWLGDKISFEAIQRVGSMSRLRLHWLACDFAARTDCRALDNSAVPEGIALEVAIFVLYEGGAGSFNLGVLPPLPSRTLERLAAEVREGLEAFIDGGVWELNVNQRLVRRLSRQVRELPPDQGKIEIRSVWSGRSSDAATFRNVFLLTAHDLLVREGEWLARCQFHGCKTPFVKDDGRQKYCGDAHAARDRVHRYRTGRTGEKS